VVVCETVRTIHILTALVVCSSLVHCSARRGAKGEPKPVDDSLECKDIPELSDSSGRDKSAIQHTLNEHQSDLSHCFQDALARDDKAQGKLVTRIVIEASGSVSSVCIHETTLDDGEAVECMLDELEDIRFGRAKGQVTIVHPLKFRSGG
jgi:hypothetical protein